MQHLRDRRSRKRPDADTPERDWLVNGDDP